MKKLNSYEVVNKLQEMNYIAFDCENCLGDVRVEYDSLEIDIIKYDNLDPRYMEVETKTFSLIDLNNIFKCNCHWEIDPEDGDMLFIVPMSRKGNHL